MAKVIVHIGPHKTATSFVQAVFHHNRSLLKRHGVFYPKIGSAQAQHALAGVWLDMPDLPEGFFGNRTPQELWVDLIEPYAKEPGVLFLSSENFSRLHPEAVDMSDLARRLENFDDVKLVYTMRRQVDLVPSIWAQIAKMRFVPSVWSFMRETLEDRRAKGVPIDHNAFYERLCQAFSPSQIHLFDYSSFKSRPDGVAGAFMELLGVPIETTDLKMPTPQEANVSPDPLSLFVAGALEGDASRPPTAELVAYLQTVLDRVVGPKRTLLAKHEYKKFRERFRHGNQALVEKVQEYQPEFAFDEGSVPSDLVYRDDLDAGFWQAIASEIYRMPQGLKRS